MKMTGNRHMTWVLFATIGLLVAPLTVAAQVHGSGGSGHGDGGGGGGGCGDVFGDLIHILRDTDTGQPILAQRWVEMPAALPGYGWGYCPIPVYREYLEDKGEWVQHELPFLPYSCDIDKSYQTLVEEVDYFGRLSGGRTKERNHRMRFDEVISDMKQADLVTIEETGRIRMGFKCETLGTESCEEYSTVDSPMQSIALYVRLMKYGHIQTDPFEVDAWAHGDPSLPEQYHAALDEEDYKKFSNQVTHLLPQGKKKPDCFAADGSFFEDCAAPEDLTKDDLLGGAAYLGAAANKTGWITVDLVQYLNRILKITKDTEHTVATKLTLPALYRDCWPAGPDPADPPEEGPVSDPAYITLDDCSIEDAVAPVDCKSDPDSGTPNYCDFPDLQERFVDFSAMKNYSRSNPTIEVVVEITETLADDWILDGKVRLQNWIEFVNGKNDYSNDNIDGFVSAASDVLRSIEFIHNYAPPENLWCVYDPHSEKCGVL